MLRPKNLVLAILCVVVWKEPAAAADQFGTSRVNGIEIVANGVTVLSNPNFLSSASLCGTWDSSRGTAEQTVQDKIDAFNTSGTLPDGVALVRHETHLSQACAASTSFAPGSLSVNVKLPRNTIITNVTTPGPLPQKYDPRVSVDFDVEVTTQIEILSSPQGRLGIGRTTVAVFNVVPDGQNLTGDVAKAIYDLIDYFKGGEFSRALAQGQAFNFAGVGKDLGPLNDQLRNPIEAAYDPAREILTLRATTGTANVADPRCISGYVWREAYNGDIVCVTPETRAQVRADNKIAGQRTVEDPLKLDCRRDLSTGRAVDCHHGAPCIPGFVWREASADDLVCVTPAQRQQAKEDNASAARRRMGYQEVVH